MDDNGGYFTQCKMIQYEAYLLDTNMLAFDRGALSKLSIIHAQSIIPISEAPKMA